MFSQQINDGKVLSPCNPYVKLSIVFILCQPSNPGAVTALTQQTCIFGPT